MREFMLIAALSGMTREEIGQLTVEDVQGPLNTSPGSATPAFRVRNARTASGNRFVPIHPDLTAIAERRTKGKANGHYLFNELELKGFGRTDPIGKAFTRYRRRLGIQDGDERRSLVKFHSFRR